MWLHLPCTIFLDFHFSHLNYPSLQCLYKPLHNTPSLAQTAVLVSEPFSEVQSSGLGADTGGFSLLHAGAAGTLCRGAQAVRVSRGISGASIRHLGRITHQTRSETEQLLESAFLLSRPFHASFSWLLVLDNGNICQFAAPKRVLRANPWERAELRAGLRPGRATLCLRLGRRERKHVTPKCS